MYTFKFAVALTFVSIVRFAFHFSPSLKVDKQKSQHEELDIL